MNLFGYSNIDYTLALKAIGQLESLESPAAGTKKLTNDIISLLKEAQTNILPEEVGTGGVIKISGHRRFLLPDYDGITFTADTLSKVDIILKQGTITLKGPIYGVINILSGKVIIEVDALTKTCPFGFINGGPIDFEI